MSEQNNPSVSFFGKMLTFSRVKLDTDDFEIIKKQLDIVSPTKDSKIPIIIETSVPQKLEELLDLFREWGLQPIGVVTGVLDEQAQALKIAIFPGDGKRLQRIQPKANVSKPKEAPQAIEKKEEHPVQSTDEEHTTAEQKDISDSDTDVSNDNLNAQTVDESSKDLDKSDTEKTEQDTEEKADASESKEPRFNQTTETTYFVDDTDRITSLVYNKMLRSGQSINHVGGDLILTSTVNNGSEAITDNNLHIYGKGLGRLVAGATGDKDAHIFCQSFNPTLVSVAGTYCLRDNIPEEFIDQPVHISYKEGVGLVYRIMDN